MGKISELEMMDIACDELVDTLAATGIDLMQAMSSKLDTDAGLRYCADDKNFYIETIHSYMVDNKIKELEKQYQLRDWREYRMIVHAIKGTSKTIGALDLFQEAEKLEMAAKDLDEDYILANHDSFLEAYNILLEFIHDTFLAAQRINDGVNDDVLASQGEVLNSAQYVVDSLENLNNQIVGTSSATISGAEVLASMKASIGMANILVVDDTYMYLQLMKKILSGKHNVYLAESAEAALEMLDLIHVDLMLLDVHMPDVDGLELLRIIRNNSKYNEIPVILLTADEDEETESAGFEEGAIDYIRKPFNNTIALQRIHRVLELSYLQKSLVHEVEKQTRKAESRRIRVEKMSTQVIAALAGAVDAKDRYTNGHSSRVAKYSVMIGERMGYDDEQLKQLEYAALLHDVGKIGIPDSIIKKSSGLTDQEYEIIKSHPVIGSQILSKITEIPNIEIGAKWHHERFDGKGYPDHLQGYDIPEVARIIGVADTYDAMASKRSYRDTLPQNIVRQEIEKGVGTQFDPAIAQIMLDIIDEDTDYKLQE